MTMDGQEAINLLRARVIVDRLLLLQSATVNLAGEINAVLECPDLICGTARREMQLRCVEGDLASAAKFLKFFLDDIAKTP